MTNTTNQATETARNLLTQWHGTDPMHSLEDVRAAVRDATSDDRDAPDVDAVVTELVRQDASGIIPRAQ